MRIEFSPPEITEEDIAAVSETLRSGWITTGPKVLEFEVALAAWSKTPKVVCLNSATAAMECILQLLAIGPGDEVITSAYTYTASASVITHVGATPVLVDVLPGSYLIDPQAVAAAVTLRTKAVIAVDIGGVMCDYFALRKVLGSPQVFRKYKPRKGTLQECFNHLPIISDAAHSFGSTYHGLPSGSVADFTAFSFHAVKNLTTAEGGALTWRAGLGSAASPGDTHSASFADAPSFDETIYQRAKLYSLHGQDKDALTKATGGWEYDIVAPLYKCNMTDIAAALGLSQFSRYQQTLKRRHELVKLYTEKLQEFARADGYSLDILAHNVVADSISNSISNCHLMMVRLLDRDDDFRRRFIKQMADLGVACNVHFKPLPLLTAYMMLGFDISNYPNAWAQYENQVSLPLHNLLSDDDVEYVCSSFAKAYQECLNG